MAVNRKLVQGTAVLSVNLFAGQIIGLIYAILGTRYFSPSEYGKIMSGVATSMIAATLLDFGFSQESLRRQISDSSFRFEFSRNRLATIALLGGAAVTGLYVLGSGISLAAVPLIGIAWHFSVLATIPYRAELKFTELSVRSSFGRLLGFTIAAISLFLNPNTFVYVSGFASIYIFEAFFLLYFGKRRYPLQRNSDLIPSMRSSLAAVLPVIQSLDVLAIRLASPAAAGYYSAVNKWPAALGSFVTALNLANFSNHLKSGSNKYWQRDLAPFYTIIVLISLTTLFLSGTLINLILPASYFGSLNSFRILILVSLITFWNQVYFSRFIAKGLHGPLILIYTIWTTCQIFLLFYVTKNHTLEKALWSLLTIQILMLVSFIITDRERS